MKKICIIIAVLGCAITGMAQEKGTSGKGSDTTRFKIGTIEFIVIDNDTTVIDTDQLEDPDRDLHISIDPKELTYWSGFGVGVNMFMNYEFKPTVNSPHLQIDPANSFHYTLNLMEHRFRIADDYFGLVTGIGFSNSRFGFQDDRMRLASNADSTYGVIDTTLANGFSKNQLRVSYFNIPLLLHFNTSKNKNKNLYLSLGVIGGVRIGSKMRYKYDVLGGETKDKTKGTFNLNPFHASLTARMGYRNLGLFANFDMLPLFKEGTSEVAKPLTFGATLNF